MSAESGRFCQQLARRRGIAQDALTARERLWVVTPQVLSRRGRGRRGLPMQPCHGGGKGVRLQAVYNQQRRRVLTGLQVTRCRRWFPTEALP